VKATTRASDPGAFARELPADVRGWLPILHEAPAWVVVPHLGPDADTLGSSLAMAGLLRALGKPAWVACQDAVAGRYDYLPGAADVVVNALPADLPAGAGAIACDAATFDRLGAMGPLIADRRPLVNIDHHVSNPGWGSHNLVDAASAATGEVVYMLYDHFGVPVDRDAAVCLYAALVTDTGGFRFPATTRRTMAVAAELLATGIDAPAIGAAIYERRSAASLRLLGLALASLRVGAAGRLAWITVPLSMFEQAGAREDEADPIAEKLREIAGVECLFVARESRDGGVRVSLRSKGRVDVNRIAQTCRGGGHVQAAGCTIYRPLAEVEAHLVAAFEEALAGG
jgi:phosphoesterase RecJ-like protein